jgi:hypothetical protein
VACLAQRTGTAPECVYVLETRGHFGVARLSKDSSTRMLAIEDCDIAVPGYCDSTHHYSAKRKCTRSSMTDSPPIEQ